ncbi:hypothetical protein EJB05_12314, partial [Eragrostis curvula]
MSSVGGAWTPPLQLARRRMPDEESRPAAVPLGNARAGVAVITHGRTERGSLAPRGRQLEATVSAMGNEPSSGEISNVLLLTCTFIFDLDVLPSHDTEDSLMRCGHQQRGASGDFVNLKDLPAQCLKMFIRKYNICCMLPLGC